jgi:hypothetical protein
MSGETNLQLFHRQCEKQAIAWAEFTQIVKSLWTAWNCQEIAALQRLFVESVDFFSH